SARDVEWAPDVAGQPGDAGGRAGLVGDLRAWGARPASAALGGPGAGGGRPGRGLRLRSVAVAAGGRRAAPVAFGAAAAAQRPRGARGLAGGGVSGGMHEVGTITDLEERMNSHGRFDIYIGCSAGAVVASILAAGVPASELFRIIDHDLDDPVNFRRSAVFASDSFRHAAGRFGRLVWAIGKNAI